MTNRLDARSRVVCGRCQEAFRNLRVYEIHRRGPRQDCHVPTAIGMVVVGDAYGFEGRVSRKLGGTRPPLVYRKGLVIEPGRRGYVWPDYGGSVIA